MGYGVYSKHDETQHLAEIVKPLFDSEPKKKGRPRKVTPRKFAMLAQQASTRVIPYYGLRRIYGTCTAENQHRRV